MYCYVGECKNCWCAGTETRVSSKLSPHSHTCMLIVYFTSPKLQKSTLLSLTSDSAQRIPDVPGTAAKTPQIPH